ncbi:hypothetical protein JCM6882_002657 [Rhodosporidiobolus microsporus]
MEDNATLSSSASSTAIDIAQLDTTCESCFSPDAATRQPDAWTKVPAIIAQTRSATTRFFALQILERQVSHAWGGLDLEERTSVRNFVLAAINDAAGFDSPLRSDRAYLLKLNGILLKIVLLDWPQDWPEFLDIFLESAQASPGHCENALVFFRLLAVDLDEQDSQMSSSKCEKLQAQFREEVHKIYPLAEAALRPVDQLEPGGDLLCVPIAVSTLASVFQVVDCTKVFGSALPSYLLQCLRFPELQPQAMAAIYLLVHLLDIWYEPVIDYAIAVLETLEGCSPPPSASKSSYKGWKERAGDDIALPLTVSVATENATPRIRQLATYAHELLADIARHEDSSVLEVCFNFWSARPTPQTDPCLVDFADEQAAHEGVLLVLLERMPPVETQRSLNDEGELVREEPKETSTSTLRADMVKALVIIFSQISARMRVMRDRVLATDVEAKRLQFLRLTRATAALQSDLNALVSALTVALHVLEDAPERPLDLVDEACDAFWDLGRLCGPALTSGQPSHLALILRNQWPKIRKGLSGSVEHSRKAYSAIAAILRHVKSPEEREQLIRSVADPLLEDISGDVISLQNAANFADPALRQESAAYSLAQDTLANGSPLHLPSSSASASSTATHALTFFTKSFLPSWLAVIMPDFERTPIELVELSLLECCQDVLVYIGTHLDPAVLLSLLLPGISFMLRNSREGRFEDFPELRSTCYVIFGYAISHQALRLEQHPPQAQDELAELSLYGMKIADRSVAKNALSAAYHLLNSASPTRISAMTPSEASAAFSFFRRHSHTFLSTVWSLANDPSREHVYEMQAPLIARVWEIGSSYEEHIFPEEAYQAEEDNVGLLRRWFIEMLLQAFPLLSSDLEACYAIFDDLWQMPRDNLADEEAFGRRLSDYLLDLQPYRGVGRVGM